MSQAKHISTSPLQAPVDVTIIGAGPVGLALGLSLHQAGIVSRILDARPQDAAHQDRRIIALSHGSRQTLERLSAWPIGATLINSIHISQQGSLGRTLLTAADQKLPALGYVVDASLLSSALEEACMRCDIHVEYGTQVESFDTQDPSSTHATLHLLKAGISGQQIETQLIACAEGSINASDSDDTAIVRRDYQQQALIATVQTQAPHEGRAWERFTLNGPIALLPYRPNNDHYAAQNGDRYALVWTTTDQAAPALMAQDDASLLKQLTEHFGGRHQFVSISKRHVFPLSLRYRRKPIDTRQVWLGNAAQTLHPVAGQGFNLALRDVSALTKLILENPSSDVGNAALLARYAANRRLDRGGTIRFTDSLITVFGGENPLLRHARGAGLALLDLIPPARSFVARRMIFGARF